MANASFGEPLMWSVPVGHLGIVSRGFRLIRMILVATARPGARLDVTAPGATSRMASSATGTTSRVAWAGGLQLGVDDAVLTDVNTSRERR